VLEGGDDQIDLAECRESGLRMVAVDQRGPRTQIVCEFGARCRTASGEDQVQVVAGGHEMPRHPASDQALTTDDDYPPHVTNSNLLFVTYPAAARSRYLPSVTELLFSYGTLRQPEVQRATFGREIDGSPDAIVGYELDHVTITDPHVIATSGSD